jgi:UDP-galactopyranose mutase
VQHDYLINGAGFFGIGVAERIANQLVASVLVIDRRSHMGGNCYSAIDPETYIEYHEYGTHIFHTASKKAWDYINKFTEFNSYHHQVLTMHQNKVYQMPINLETINTFYNMSLRPLGAKLFIEDEIGRENITEPRNLEEKAVSLIGKPLYEAFIKGYTIKQWGKIQKTCRPSSFPDCQRGTITGRIISSPTDGRVFRSRAPRASLNGCWRRQTSVLS